MGLRKLGSQDYFWQNRKAGGQLRLSVLPVPISRPRVSNEGLFKRDDLVKAFEVIIHYGCW